MVDFLGGLERFGSFADKVAQGAADVELNALRFDDPAAYNQIIQSQQLGTLRQQELDMRKAERASEIERKRRFGEVVVGGVLGGLSEKLGIPPELLATAESLGDLSTLGRLTQPTAAPAGVREFQYVQGLPPEQQEEYYRLKRRQQVLNLGGQFVSIDPRTGQPVSTIEKTLAPADRPETKAAQKTAVSEAEYQAQGKQALPLQQRSLESAELRQEFIDDKIGEIKTAVNPWATGFTGSLLSAVAGSPAFDLKANVDTLLANAGFDRLQEMRDQSPTGGALGAISEREIGLLQASAQNLMTSQSYDQFQSNLSQFQKQRKRTMTNMRKAYDQDFKRFGGAQDPQLPSPEEMSRQAISERQAEIGVNQFQRPDLLPQVGAIEGGYEFLGGDPSNPASWRKK